MQHSLTVRPIHCAASPSNPPTSRAQIRKPDQRLHEQRGAHPKHHYGHAAGVAQIDGPSGWMGTLIPGDYGLTATIFRLIGTSLSRMELVSSKSPKSLTRCMPVKPASCKYPVRNSSLSPTR